MPRQPKAKDVLNLYKLMLRESQKFPSYNFKTYAVRRVRDAFKEYKSLEDQQQIEDKLKLGKSSLELIRRQASVANLYQTHKSIIEQQPKEEKQKESQ